MLVYFASRENGTGRDQTRAYTLRLRDGEGSSLAGEQEMNVH